MFLLGHLAWGYVLGRATSKWLKTNVNIPLLFLVSALPDIDVIVPSLVHRGLTHSIVLLSLSFIPVFLVYKKRTVPYFTALIQHILFGDILGGEMMLWPLTSDWYELKVCSHAAMRIDIFLEWTGFLLSLGLLIKMKDLAALMKQHSSNTLFSIIIIGIWASLLGSNSSIGLPVPAQLILPHLIYLTIFTLSFLSDLFQINFFESLKKLRSRT